MGEAVTGFWRRLIDFVSRGLEPAEREAVLGDLAESTASGAEKLRDVLGLVVRRHDFKGDRLKRIVQTGNAQLSTSPRTEEGKRRSSLNAFRHGLTGQIVIHTPEDQAAFQKHCEAWPRRRP